MHVSAGIAENDTLSIICSAECRRRVRWDAVGMSVSTKLQPLRGVVGLDGLALYDYGGVTAFDAAGGRGDGAGDVAGGQHHRETYRQGGE